MNEQQTAAMRQALEACPFCGGEAEYQKDSVRSGYGEYESHETYHAIKCKKCGSSSKRIHQKHLIDFTKYTVRDFRENPILRAKVEDDYDAYCEQSKQLAIDAWNCRALEQQPAEPSPYNNPQAEKYFRLYNEVCETAVYRLREIARLEGLLAAKPADEPVAYCSRLESGSYTYCNTPQFFDNAEPLYTRPQPAAWVSLTDEELSEVYNQPDWDTVNGWEYERAIEAKLREKNGAPESITDFKERLAKSIEAMPFGDTAASFAIFIRDFK